MQLETVHFGVIDINEADFIYFPEGILGLNRAKDLHCLEMMKKNLFSFGFRVLTCQNYVLLSPTRLWFMMDMGLMWKTKM